jgi:uncharacterized phage protein (TIGR02220 family)
LKTKAFYKALSEKPLVYGMVWIFILGRVGEEISYADISRRANGISKSYIHQIIQWGLKKMKLHQINYEFDSGRSGVNFNFTVYKPQIATKDEQLVANIITHLNETSGKHFSPTSKETIKVIEARLKDGYTLDDFKKVIDTKCTKWINTEFEDYLRPITLFGNKFNSYLNEKPTIQRLSAIQKTITTAVETSSVDWGLDNQ